MPVPVRPKAPTASPFAGLTLLMVLAFLTMNPAAAAADAAELALFDLSQRHGWTGGVADSLVTHEGKPSLKWEHRVSPLVENRQIPRDLRAFNCLRFALHSAKATAAPFRLVLVSDRPETDGSDCYSFEISLDWTGWKEFSVLFSEMVSSLRPVGWGKIDAVSFSAQGWDNQPNPESLVHIADLRLRSESGIMSDKEFISLVDLDHPGLKRAKAAAEDGDYARAKHEFAQHLRTRAKPVWRSDWRARPRHPSRPEGVDTTEADRILRHDMQSAGVYHKFDGQIDWALNPIDCPEWPYALNRHHAWVTLGHAYWATGDEKYAREFVSQMTDWVRRYPVPRQSHGRESGMWRTIEAGIRTGQTWPEAFHLFLSSPSFDDEAIITMAKSSVDHARHLMRYPTDANWLVMECNGLVHTGVLFPEFKDAALWRKTGMDRLYKELDYQVYPDGAQIELSNSYQHVCLDNFVMAYEIARLNDLAMPDGYVARIQKMYDYDLKASMPDGTVPGLNDGSQGDVRYWLGQGLRFFPDRKDYQWVATGGAKGKVPSFQSVALPFAGQLIMRTGWGPEDLYMLMDFGPYGPGGHPHEDALSLVVHSYGRYHLVDAGNYLYNSSPWRKYVVSTRGHNTIRVDGQDQNRREAAAEQYIVSKPLANKWIAGKGFDYAAGTYGAGYGEAGRIKVVHNRHVFFVRPEYWIIADFLTPADSQSHRYESLFHIDDQDVRVEPGKAVRSHNKAQGNISIIPLDQDGLSVRIVSGQETPEVQGWMPASGQDVRPIPTAVYEQSRSGSSSFACLVYPTAAGATCPVAFVEPLKVTSGGRAAIVGMAIRFSGGRTDYFVQADGSAGTMRFLDFETDASAAYVREVEGKVTSAMLAGGRYITRGGKQVPAEIRTMEDLSKTNAAYRK